MMQGMCNSSFARHNGCTVKHIIVQNEQTNEGQEKADNWEEEMLMKLKLLYLERITHVFEFNICRRQELSFVLFDFILYSESVFICKI